MLWPQDAGVEQQDIQWLGRQRRRQRAEESGGPWILWLSRLLFFVLLIACLGLAVAMLHAQLHAIILGALLGSLFSPVHGWVSRRLPRWPNLSALVCVTLVFVVLLVPSGLLLSAVVRQGATSVRAVQEWVGKGGLPATVARVDLAALADRPVLRALRPALARWFGVQDLRDVDLSNSRLSEALTAVGHWLLNALAGCIRPLIAGTGQFLAGFFIMLFVLFFVFRDGAIILAHVRRLIPLARTQQDALLGRVRDVSRAVVFGTAVTALAQGLAAMIAFSCVGIPALFWGTVLAVVSLIPAVGTALVWVPAVGYLLLAGRPGAAVFLAIWCTVVVGSIDNVLRPLVMGGRSGMSSLMVFLSVLGGIQLFGPMGLVYGPLVFGLCAVLLYIYERENAGFLDRQSRH